MSFTARYKVNFSNHSTTSFTLVTSQSSVYWVSPVFHIYIHHLMLLFNLVSSMIIAEFFAHFIINNNQSTNLIFLFMFYISSFPRMPKTPTSHYILYVVFFLFIFDSPIICKDSYVVKSANSYHCVFYYLTI